MLLKLEPCLRLTAADNKKKWYSKMMPLTYQPKTEIDNYLN